MGRRVRKEREHRADVEVDVNVARTFQFVSESTKKDVRAKWQL